MIVIIMNLLNALFLCRSPARLILSNNSLDTVTHFEFSNFATDTENIYLESCIETVNGFFLIDSIQVFLDYQVLHYIIKEMN